MSETKQGLSKSTYLDGAARKPDAGVCPALLCMTGWGPNRGLNGALVLAGAGGAFGLVDVTN